MLRVNLLPLIFTILLSFQALSVPSCLYEDEHISKECLVQVEIDELKKNSELAYYLCPIYLKQNLLEMSEQICYFVAMLNLPGDTMNMYNLIEVYLKRNKWIQAIQAEYQAFWVTPFDHEQKLKKALDNALLFLEGSQAKEKANSQKLNEQLSNAIRSIYYKQYPQALTFLQKHHQKSNSSSEEVAISWPFLPELLKLRILDKMGQFPDGFEFVNSLLASHTQKFGPITWFLHHIRGNFLMHHIRFKQSIQAFKESIFNLENTEQHSGREISSKLQLVLPKIFPLSIYNLALSLQKTNQFALSATYLRNLIQHPSFSAISNECSQCYNALGFAYYQLGLEVSDQQQKQQQFRLARKYLDYAQKYQDDNSYSATFNKGALEYSIQNYKEAFEKFERVLEINSNVVSAKYGYLKSLFKVDEAKGEQYLNQLKESPKANYFQLAQIMYELGNPRECLSLLKKYHQQIEELDLSLSSDELVHLYTWKGLIEYELDQNKDAFESLQKAISIDEAKVDAQVLEAVGDLYIQNGRSNENLEKSIELYKKAIAKYRKSNNTEKTQHLEKTIKQIQKFMREQL